MKVAAIGSINVVTPSVKNEQFTKEDKKTYTDNAKVFDLLAKCSAMYSQGGIHKGINSLKDEINNDRITEEKIKNEKETKIKNTRCENFIREKQQFLASLTPEEREKLHEKAINDIKYILRHPSSSHVLPSDNDNNSVTPGQWAYFYDTAVYEFPEKINNFKKLATKEDLEEFKKAVKLNSLELDSKLDDESTMSDNSQMVDFNTTYTNGGIVPMTYCKEAIEELDYEFSNK